MNSEKEFLSIKKGRPKNAVTGVRNKSIHLCVTVTPQMKSVLKAMANQGGVPEAVIARRLLADSLSRTVENPQILSLANSKK